MPRPFDFWWCARWRTFLSGESPNPLGSGKDKVEHQENGGGRFIGPAGGVSFEIAPRQKGKQRRNIPRKRPLTKALLRICEKSLSFMRRPFSYGEWKAKDIAFLLVCQKRKSIDKSYDVWVTAPALHSVETAMWAVLFR